MNSKRFTLLILVQIILITTTSIFLAWAITQHMIVSRITFSLLLAGQTLLLIQHVQKNNKLLSNFLEALQYRDFMTHLPEHNSNNTESLQRAYNKALDEIGHIEVEKEKERLFYLHILSEIKTGILVYNPNGNIKLSNSAANDLFNLHHLTHLHQLELSAPLIYKTILRMGNHDSCIINTTLHDQTLNLSLHSSKYIEQGEILNILTIQNIRSELEANEADAWQKLIRVLTHEIMNSVSPVKSLTGTLIRMFTQEGKPKLPNMLEAETIEEAVEGLEAINKRNQGLLSFVESYRQLTRIPEPTLNNFNVNTMLKTTLLLFNKDYHGTPIRWNISIEPENLEIKADEKLIVQIIINLLKNAISALQNTTKPIIHLTAGVKNNRPFITVQDNGHGIANELKDKIFIPFFTTRINGSGIGLSLSRQIMRLHQGKLEMQTKQGEGTSFTLRF